ncbi:MAG: 3-oxoacyl-[acyl-carrier-protein] reductase [Butyrivibrio sp.]|jgi:3-oxoacyl-[acyl-carrier protein] reductase|nr:3-oxoacyl-[acyl-carrier-protein] reductase [Butyrivibrio sp.]
MEQNQPLKRVALITGASRGIGRAISISLAAEGMNVCINYAGNEAAALKTKALCEEASPDITALTVQADISSEEGCHTLIQSALDAFGRIDVLINNAGITQDNLLVRMDTQQFDRVIALNLRGAFLCCQAVTRTMMKQRYGRIINISSIVGLHGNAGQVNYAASKAGLIGLTKSIAKELASRNITANAIAPGFIETDMSAAMTDAAKAATLAQIPCGREGLPSDVAEAVRFLASEKASYITGQVLGVDGGMGI